MSGIFWNWKYYIAPAPVIEKQTNSDSSSRLFKHWGMYVTKNVFKGLKHPTAGDVVQLPDYGPCKVERVLFWAARPSRGFILGIVISPSSLGNDEWWSENRNHPVAKHGDNWTLEFEIPKSYFKDLNIPQNDYIE